MTDMTLESYTKTYNHREVILKLKGHKTHKKRGLFKRIFYLARQFHALTYHSCGDYNNSQYNKRAEFCTTTNIDIELLKKTCEKYISDCKMTILNAKFTSFSSDLRINLEFNNENVNWILLNYDLINEHSDNVYDHQALHFTLKDYCFKWWEQVKLNFEFEN